jgi:hypothetical protein
MVIYYIANEREKGGGREVDINRFHRGKTVGVVGC